MSADAVWSVGSPADFQTRVLRFARRLRRSPVGIVGVVIVAAVIFIAVAAPLLAPYDPTTLRLERRLVPPAWVAGGSTQFILGTDNLGRDVLSRVLYGSRVSVIVGT